MKLHTTLDTPVIDDLFTVMGLLDKSIRMHLVPDIDSSSVQCNNYFNPLMTIVSKYRNELQQALVESEDKEVFASLLEWTYLSDHVDKHFDKIGSTNVSIEDFGDFYNEELVQKVCAIVMSFWFDVLDAEDPDDYEALDGMKDYIFNKLLTGVTNEP